MKKENTMSKNLKTEAVDHLFDAILCLKDRAECYTFFEKRPGLPQPQSAE